MGVLVCTADPAVRLVAQGILGWELRSMLQQLYDLSYDGVIEVKAKAALAALAVGKASAAAAPAPAPSLLPAPQNATSRQTIRTSNH